MSHTDAAASRQPHAPDRWGHPRQLWMLLAVTVGINFAFYGFRAFLAPYIAQHFHAGLGDAAAQRQADLLASGFLALMYAAPIVGGYVADKILGETRALAMSMWLGELALSPIGYALVGQLAAPEESSLAMGGWFFGMALAYQLAGWIAEQTTSATASGALGGLAEYGHVYALLFWAGLAVAVVFLIAAPWIKRLMHGVH